MVFMQMEVVLASRNAGKAREFERMLGSFFTVQPLNKEVVMPAETGITFAENARIKAEAVFAAIDGSVAVLADDSGLEVSVLAGAPGIYSARYAGKAASDKENIEKLLHDLEGLSEREARFVCNLCLIVPVTSNTSGVFLQPAKSLLLSSSDKAKEHNQRAVGRVGSFSKGVVFEVRGLLEGTITETPRGKHGFGYDPVFCPQGWLLTLAEVLAEQKDALSHRAVAVKELVRVVSAHEVYGRKPGIPASPEESNYGI